MVGIPGQDLYLRVWASWSAMSGGVGGAGAAAVGEVGAATPFPACTFLRR